MIINAKNASLGRLASFAAKKVLLGEEVIIVNCEQAIITGNKRRVIEEYKKRRKRGTPEKGPKFPSTPGRILKRAIRGMLPKTNRGKELLKKVKCYNGVPEKYAKEKKISSGKEKFKFVSLRKISRELK